MADISRDYTMESESCKHTCNYCRRVFPSTTSKKRLNAHIIGQRNVGVTPCPSVPDPVKSEIIKRQRTETGNIPSPSVPRTLVSQPNESGANNFLVNQEQENHLREDEITDMIRQLQSDAIPSPSVPRTLVSQPNESGANNCLVNQEQENHLREDESTDMIRQLQSDAIFSPEEQNNFFNYCIMPPHPNESASVANLLLQNVTNFQAGVEPSEVVNGGTTQPVERGSTHQPYPLTTTDSPLANEGCGNLEPEAFPPTDLGTQEFRNPCLTVDAHQHGVGDAANQTENNRVSPTADVLTDDADPNGVQMVEGIQDTGESASLTKRPVGDAFGRNVEKICSWLMDDQVLRVGIYGMGGVGKTTLMRHIQTLLEGQSSFEVYWITVSQDFSIWKLQNLIAKKIDLNFSDEEDEVKRAEKLAQEMQAKGKCVLILDDLRDNFDVAEVGIPVVGLNPCKLVLTTRSLKVCQQMDCSERNTIEVQALSKGEAWTLFTQELGSYNTEEEVVQEVKELAKAVCRECACLPLGIRVMARSMNGICDVHTWKETLDELKKSKLSKGHEMQEEVFSVLKFSYLRLKDPALRECLSYCVLFQEEDMIGRNELIEYMIVEGIIDDRKSRQEELDKGDKMLDTLENACLLEGDTKTVWMHDLIRDMLILELREGSKTFVEAGAQLKELPAVERWTEKLVRVSLMGNDIEEIPSGYTPKCPNLSTLLLCRNHRLKLIADSFFEQFQKLKVLDLSWCREIEELPRSISNLVNLTALLLRGCRSLVYVPSLEKQEKLKKLDLSDCERLKQMPEGVRFLLNLKYLDLSGTGIEEIRSGIIPILSGLQVFKLCDQNGTSKISIRGSEVGGLRMLETLHCKFSDPSEFGEYMKSRQRSQQSPSDYSIFINRGNPLWPTTSRKFVSVTGYSSIDSLALPKDIETLNIYNCKGLFPPDLLASLQYLQEIRVYEENGEWREFPFSNYSTHSLSFLLHLKLINIDNCDKLKKLFPPCLLPKLHNLEIISVEHCNGMEEIFSTDQEEEDGPNLNLSRLTTLKLRYLPELRSIYKGAVICQSLKEIELRNCPKLQSITLHLPQPSLKRTHFYPSEWWDSVQWGSANHKNYLKSLS